VVCTADHAATVEILAAGSQQFDVSGQAIVRDGTAHICAVLNGQMLGSAPFTGSQKWAMRVPLSRGVNRLLLGLPKGGKNEQNIVCLQGISVRPVSEELVPGK
jgi:hypothetical protein